MVDLSTERPPAPPREVGQAEPETGHRRLDSTTYKDVGAVALAMAVLVILVWTYDGINVTAISDGWRSKYSIETTGLQSHLEDTIDTRSISLRFFRLVPYQVGHSISQGSFLGHQLVLLTLTVLKGFLAYLLLRELLPDRFEFNFLVASLYVFYPADSSHFWIGATGLHFISVVSIAAALCLTIALKNESGRWMVGASLFLVVSLWGYPGFLLQLAAFPLLALLITKPPQRILIRFGAIWYSIVALNLLMQYSRYEGGYNDSIADPDGPELIESYVRAFERLFYSGWTESINGLSQARVLACAVAFALLTGYILFKSSSWSRAVAPISARGLVSLAGVGIGLIVISFFPYSMTIHRFSNSRTLLVASLGAAIVVGAAGLYAMQRLKSKTVTIVIGSILVGLSVSYAINLRQQFVDRSVEQQLVIAQVIDEVPTPGHGEILMIFAYDDISSAQGIRGFYNEPTSALRLLYDDEEVTGLSLPTARNVTITERYVEMIKPFSTPRELYRWHYEDIIVFRVDENLQLRMIESLQEMRRFESVDAGRYDPYALIEYTIDRQSSTCTMFSNDGLRPTVCGDSD